MQPGEKVQVKQGDGPNAHWIYAKVVTANTDGSALVLIQHQLNIDHGKLFMASPEEIRDKAAVLALADAIKGSDKATREARQALESQADWLTGAIS